MAVSRIARSEVMGLQDIMSTDNFSMTFASIPFTEYDPYKTFTLTCQNAVIPGTRNEAFQVQLGGYTRFFRGRQDFDHQLSLEFAIPRDLTTINGLRTWHEGIAGSMSGTSEGYQADYSTTADLFVYDTAGKVVDVATFYRLFLADAPTLPMEESRTSPMIGTANFHYDYVEWASTTQR